MLERFQAGSGVVLPWSWDDDLGLCLVMQRSLVGHIGSMRCGAGVMS